MNSAYIVISEKNIKNLQEMVNSKITAGYLPLGGVAVTEFGGQGNALYLQAMILKNLSDNINLDSNNTALSH